MVIVKKYLQLSLLTGALLLTKQVLAQTATMPQDFEATLKALCHEAPGLNPRALQLGLVSYQKARAEGFDNQQILTIVDYSQASTVPRLWVFDLKNNNLLFQELVAHAKNSGENIPTVFSDQPQSLKSSLGLFVTGEPYQGQHGYSLRLNGLEKGFNKNAAARNIVVHAANYVSPQFASTHGRLGRSFGCFALNPSVANAVINTIKAGTLLFAYAPDRNWLTHSKYL